MTALVEEEKKSVREMRELAEKVEKTSEVVKSPLAVITRSKIENVFKTVVLRAFDENLPEGFHKLSAEDQTRIISEKGKVTALTYFLNKSLVMNELLLKHCVQRENENRELYNALRKMEQDLENDVYAQKCGRLQAKVASLERELEKLEKFKRVIVTI